MEIVIDVQNLSKIYNIGISKNAFQYNTIQERLAHIFRPFRNEFKKFHALTDVSFKVAKGERLGIIGTNGAGKSTLLKILSKITPPTAGKIILNGKISSLLEIGTGFHPELTGRENIYLNGSILGMTKNEINTKFEEIVSFSEVSDFLDTPVKRYSSGMYMRLAFSIAAHLEPDILIIDEVLSVGDIKFQDKCIGKIKDIGQKLRTVLIVSHNLETILNLCEKSIVMEKGKIVFHGPTKEAITFYRQNALGKPYSIENFENRGGTGEAEITNVYISPSRQLNCTEKVEIHISAKINKTPMNFKDIEFCIGIDDEFNNRLWTVSSASNNRMIINTSSTESTVVCAINSLPLVQGRYIISVSLVRFNITLDCITRCEEFYIVELDGISHLRRSDWGRLNIPCEFKIL